MLGKPTVLPVISGISEAQPGLPAAHRGTTFFVVRSALLTSSSGDSSAGGGKQTLVCVP